MKLPHYLLGWMGFMLVFGITTVGYSIYSSQAGINEPPSPAAALLQKSMLSGEGWRLAKGDDSGIVHEKSNIYINCSGSIINLQGFTGLNLYSFTKNDYKIIKETYVEARKRLEMQRLLALFADTPSDSPKTSINSVFIESLLSGKGWQNAWTNGIFNEKDNLWIDDKGELKKWRSARNSSIDSFNQQDRELIKLLYPFAKAAAKKLFITLEQ